VDIKFQLLYGRTSFLMNSAFLTNFSAVVAPFFASSIFALWRHWFFPGVGDDFEWS